MKQSTARLGLVAAAGALSLCLGAAPAGAALIADGITYTLTESATGNPLVNEFTLTITGINAATDTEGGRSGVNAIAFTRPANFSTAVMVTPPSGYVFQNGGLNAAGCDGSGNFYCFDNTSIPPIPTTPYTAGSTLTFVFDVTISSGTFTGYTPDLKIDWVGSKNNYDLVSKPIDPTPGTTVPEPMTLALFGTALLGLGVAGRRKSA